MLVVCLVAGLALPALLPPASAADTGTCVGSVDQPADGESHRVVTVTPRGDVVWTALVPWEPADATRAVTGDVPTAATLGIVGRHAVPGETATYDQLAACEAGLAETDTNRTERARTVADDGAPIGLVGALAVGAVVLAYAARRRV